MCVQCVWVLQRCVQYGGCAVCRAHCVFCNVGALLCALWLHTTTQPQCELNATVARLHCNNNTPATRRRNAAFQLRIVTSHIAGATPKVELLICLN